MKNHFGSCIVREMTLAWLVVMVVFVALEVFITSDGGASVRPDGWTSGYLDQWFVNAYSGKHAYGSKQIIYQHLCI